MKRRHAWGGFRVRLPRNGLRRQRGSALIVSLLILLVMTTLGISAMLGSTLQERMVGNQKRALETAWAAEAGAIQAVQWLRQHPDTWKYAQDWKTASALPFRPQKLRGASKSPVHWIERLEWTGETATVVSRGGVFNAAGQLVEQSTVTVVWQSTAPESDLTVSPLSESQDGAAALSRSVHAASVPIQKPFGQVVFWRLSVVPLSRQSREDEEQSQSQSQDEAQHPGRGESKSH